MMERLGLQSPFTPRKSESLSATLIRNISVVLAVTFVFIVLLTYWQSAAKVETEVGSALEIAEKTVRKVMQEIAHDDDPRLQLVRLVRVFDGNRHVKVTFVEPEPDGDRISSFVAPADELPNWFYALMAGVPEVVRVDLPGELARFGTLELKADQRGEVGEVWQDFLLRLAILSVFCALVATLVYITVGRALAPLPTLSAAFERLGGGDYDVRVAESGPTELVRLCAGFNEMADRLGHMETANQRLNDQLATVQEEERADLARDLHDEVSPFLFSIEVDASTIRQKVQSPDGDVVTERADSIREAVAHINKHVRSILGRLRPSVHMEFGLANAIETLIASWQLRDPNVTFKVDVSYLGGGPKEDAVIHGIVREAISNAFKHARPTRIDVAVKREPEGDVRVVVSDDGGGLTPDGTGGGFGFGLIAMRERVAALGGTLEIKNSENPAGVTVDVRLPIGETYAAFDGSADPEVGS